MDGDRFGGLLGGIGEDPQPRGGGVTAQGTQPAPGIRLVRGGPAPAGGPGGPHGPHGPDGGGRGGGRGGGPGPRTVVATLAAAALLAVLVGGAVGLLSGGDDVTVAAAPPAATGAASSATAEPSVTPEPDDASAPATAAVTTTPTPTPRSTRFVEDPAGAGLDFGFLKGVRRAGGTVTVTVDRATFLDGPAAADYYAANPDLEPLDYAITNTNPRLRTFRLTPDVVVYAQYALGNGTDVFTQQITLEQFVDRASGVLAADGELLVWLQHDPSPDGPVWYVAEQFTP